MTSTPLSTAELAALVDAVSAGLAEPDDDGERVERIRLLERLKAAAAAGQIREVASFAASRRAVAARAGVTSHRQDRGVAGQVGLAMRCSPWAAGRFVRTASVLATDMPAVLDALRGGLTTQDRACTAARESIFLSHADRARLDEQLAPLLERLGDRGVEAESRRLAYRLDPTGYVERVRGAESDRRVTLRPAPETMCRLSALLPLATGVSAYATLCRDADAVLATGARARTGADGVDRVDRAPRDVDRRGRGQVMADLLVSRLCGLDQARGPAAEIELIMTDRALLAGPGTPGYDEPGEVIGYGPVPAPLARELALGSGTESSTSGDTALGTAPSIGPRWLRRLFLDPVSGQLAAAESRRRCFTLAQRRFLRLRDRTCRTPWCGAPVRHADHVVTARDGGPTSVANGQSLCAACNYARQADGWAARVDADGTIVTTVPTGQEYESRQPLPPGSDTRRPTRATVALDPGTPVNRRAG